MSTRDRVDELLGRYVEHHIVHGARLAPEDLCEDAPELVEPLSRRIRLYEQLQETLGAPASEQRADAARADEALPAFEGFRTIERLGAPR